jgi:signal peptidase I
MSDDRDDRDDEDPPAPLNPAPDAHGNAAPAAASCADTSSAGAVSSDGASAPDASASRTVVPIDADLDAPLPPAGPVVPGPTAPSATDGPATDGPATDGPVDGSGEPVAGGAVPDAVPPAPAKRRWYGRRAKDDAGKRRHKAPWWELPALVALAIVIAVLVKTFLVQPFYIPSESMEHTLYGCSGCSGDRILVNKVIYDFRDPHPGDIVVFNAPHGWNEIHTSPPSNPFLRTVRGFGQLVGFVPPDGEVLVKRVIATGGETVWGVDSGGRSIVHIREKDGFEHVLREPYVFNEPPDTHATFGPVTVPKGRLWVMGDHRSDSEDSRYHCGTGAIDDNVGKNCDSMTSTVPVSDVIGKAFVIAWPPSRWRTLGTPSTFENVQRALGAAAPSAIGVLGVVPFFLRRRRRRRRLRARADA